MIQIQNNFNILSDGEKSRVLSDEEKSRIIDQWRKIVEIPLKNHTDAIVEKSCLYANSEAKSNDPTAKSLLPISLVVLNNLNLNGKNLHFVNNPTFEYKDTNDGQLKCGEIHTFTISCKVQHDLLNLHLLNVDVASYAEQILAHKLSETININLKRYDTLVVYRICNSIFTNKETASCDTVIMTSRIAFFDKNNVPDDLYEVHVSEDDVISVRRIDYESSNTVMTKDALGNNYIVDISDNTAYKAVTEIELLVIADNLEKKVGILNESIQKIRKTVLS